MITPEEIDELRELAAPRLGKGRIFLMGGGACEDLAPSLRWLVARCRAEGKSLLFLPHAWPKPMFAEYARAMFTCLQTLGLPKEDFETAGELGIELGKRLSSYGAVLLGGGNTFDLLHALRENGFAQSLIAYLQAGGTLAGNSAGAIVLGSDIRHAHDPNHVRMQDFSGLGLLGEIAIWCHYRSEIHDAEIAKLRAQRRFPFLALGERGGIRLERDRVEILEKESVRLIP